MNLSSFGLRALALFTSLSIAGACSTFSSGKKKSDAGDGDGDTGTGSSAGDGDVGDGDVGDGDMGDGDVGDGDMGDGDVGGAHGDGDGDMASGVPECDGVEDIQTVAGLIEEGESVTAGPGCVRMEDVNLDGSLTILPGTRVLLEAGAFIDVRSISSFTAEGTEDAPIVFQSEHPDPRAGDWDCFLIKSSRVNIEHASFLHGGGECILGAKDAAVLIQADVDKVAHITIESSDTVGLYISNVAKESGVLQGFSFADIDEHSLFIAPDVLSLIEGPFVLDEDETAIVVDASEPLVGPTTVKNMGLPYVFVDWELNVRGRMTIEPGVTILMTSSFNLSNDGEILAVGTEEEPITWTSPYDAPVGSEYWGSIYNITGVGARFEYNHFEYGGDHSREGVLAFDDEFVISNVSFANIETSGIAAGSCNSVSEQVDAWCALEFTDVATPVTCYANGRTDACQ